MPKKRALLDQASLAARYNAVKGRKTATSSAEVKPFRIFYLLPELRLMIWEFCYTTDEIKDLMRNPKPPKEFWSLFASCRSVFNETFPIFHQRLHSIGKKARKHMKKITMTVTENLLAAQAKGYLVNDKERQSFCDQAAHGKSMMKAYLKVQLVVEKEFKFRMKLFGRYRGKSGDW